MPVAVRNLKTGPSVFKDDETNVLIEWEGAGHPEGGDIQYVPDRLLDNVNFMSAVNKGVFAPVEDEAAAAAAMRNQADATRSASDAATAEVMSHMDRGERAPLATLQTDGYGQITEVHDHQTGRVTTHAVEQPTGEE
jgi:hypothetical protein